ncbi:helix-turn-helix transcriptional regulator [Xenorhabdus bovienii]|uniref:helix-turn-helix transcriptional regulator n=1 Tax=Xenorhabdus bovienii TaxID=40576 RepID=UPI00237C6335|nr:AlpA family phage regulatory protein [Xenorhabdus bovienii]MDE1481355.1 AlpA family phage regulatory protein [Xenorhabdus bovienii]MDE9456110.1 AlpA family phage regulatory protein [Xenorhabdus bovienii]MDE9542860.1 AlpA family phage regulatory protein [Xenorhabdus bovienii]MDE9564956.1 AlpA family phage regulatory protein [Xenorhabdus bovienii]
MNFLDKKELTHKTKLSMTQVDRLEKAGLFPGRFPLVSKKVVWDKDEVEEWMIAVKTQAREHDIQPSTLPTYNMLRDGFLSSKNQAC